MTSFFESRDLVIPGDVLFEGRTRTGDNTYRSKGKVCSTRVGLVEYGRGMVSVIALEAGYNPLVGDLIIGEVIDIELGRWVVNIESPSRAVLNLPDAIDAPFKPDIVMPDILDVEDTVMKRTLHQGFDLVVLATGMAPNTADVPIPFDLKYDDYGFIDGSTGVDGIYAAGCSKRPCDVSKAVKDAMAASIKAIQSLDRGE